MLAEADVLVKPEVPSPLALGSEELLSPRRLPSRPPAERERKEGAPPSVVTEQDPTHPEHHLSGEQTHLVLYQERLSKKPELVGQGSLAQSRRGVHLCLGRQTQWS